jgi:phage major head subunit gpT-like protein
MALDTAKATTRLRSLTEKFDNAVKAAPILYPTVAYIHQSDGANEEYSWLGQMPAVREWLGDRVFNELRAARFVIENRLWESSLLLAKTDLSDDRHGQYDLVMPEMAKRAGQHPDKLLLELIVAGEDTACFDGEFFFDTDHAWGDSGTQDNDLTYAAGSGTTPTAAEWKAAFVAAVEAILGYKDDRGEPYQGRFVDRMTDLVCVVPIEQRQVAHEAIEQTIVSNTTNVVIDKPRIVTSPGLTDATKFYTFATGQFMKPFVFQAREPLSRQIKGLDDIETKDAKFMTQARYDLGYLAWWNAVLTTFT